MEDNLLEKNARKLSLEIIERANIPDYAINNTLKKLKERRNSLDLYLNAYNFTMDNCIFQQTLCKEHRPSISEEVEFFKNCQELFKKDSRLDLLESESEELMKSNSREFNKLNVTTN